MLSYLFVSQKLDESFTTFFVLFMNHLKYLKAVLAQGSVGLRQRDIPCKEEVGRGVPRFVMFHWKRKL